MAPNSNPPGKRIRLAMIATTVDAASVLAAAIQVQTTIAQLTAAGGSGASVTTALATALETGALVDLTSSTLTGVDIAKAGLSTGTTFSDGQGILDDLATDGTGGAHSASR